MQVLVIMASYKREKQDAANMVVMKAEASVGLVNIPAEGTPLEREDEEARGVSSAEEQRLLNKVAEESLDKLV